MSGLLQGRGIVVTGAGRGLGRSYAIACAREGAGVVVNDLDVEEARAVAAEIEAEGGNAVAFGGSVAEWETAEEMVDRCVREYGAIDGLVNNAIAYSYFGAPWDQDQETVRREVEVCVNGTIFCGIQAMRRMVERRRGSIVNTTSRSMMGVTGMSTYVAVKGAAASATFAWALELMPHDVRVNAIAPGAHTRSHALATAAGTIRPSQQFGSSPDLVAPAVVYLLSDLSSRVTGQVVVMLGGRLGLLRHPKLLGEYQEQDEWTPEQLAEAFERVYGADLQPIGFEATEYQL